MLYAALRLFSAWDWMGMACLVPCCLCTAAAHLSGLTHVSPARHPPAKVRAAPSVHGALPEWLTGASPQLTSWHRRSFQLSQHSLTGLEMHVFMQSRVVTNTVLCRPHWRKLLRLWSPQTVLTVSALGEQPTGTGSSTSVMSNLAGCLWPWGKP